MVQYAYHENKITQVSQGWRLVNDSSCALPSRGLGNEVVGGWAFGNKGKSNWAWEQG